jgi:hemin uptake protein HemP
MIVNTALGGAVTKMGNNVTGPSQEIILNVLRELSDELFEGEAKITYSPNGQLFNLRFVSKRDGYNHVVRITRAKIFGSALSIYKISLLRIVAQGEVYQAESRVNESDVVHIKQRIEGMVSRWA